MRAPYWQCDDVILYQGHVLDVLKELPSESISCIVTSPPYFGLRSYGLPPIEWPGVSYAPMAGLPMVEVDAWIGSLGHEETPAAFVGHIVLMFRELKRVLRGDGTVWLNMGDAMSKGGGNRKAGSQGRTSIVGHASPEACPNKRVDSGLPAKNLLGIPWRVAFALQADGWYLRSDIIWHKPNAMPESVTDRCTKAHEYIFLLAKSKSYYYDAMAIRVEAAESTRARAYLGKRPETPKAKALRAKGMQGAGDTLAIYDRPYRNRRTVWKIPTRGSKLAHFAVMPEALVEPCIRAGTSQKGTCPKCNSPWRRVVERTTSDNPDSYKGSMFTHGKTATHQDGRAGTAERTAAAVTTGWKPTCDCGIDTTVPCTVLDPFAGTATTGVVAIKLRRKAILIELSKVYCDEQIIPRLSKPIAVELL